MSPPADVIAWQVFELWYPDGRVARVRAQLGRPRRSPERGLRWVCPMRAESPGRVIEREAYGDTSLEALRLALQMLRQEFVDDLPRLTGGDVRCAGGDVAAEYELPHQFPIPDRLLHPRRRRPE